MGESIFPGYENQLVSIGDQRISLHVGGTGTPLLLLHGYPQNHAAWIKLAVPLARNFTCVIADLPGYGASSIPADAPNHEILLQTSNGSTPRVRHGFHGLCILQRDRP